MIKYQRIQGVSLDNATNLPKIEQTPEGIAMGAVPNWVAMHDPAYASAEIGEARNRARRSSVDAYDGVITDFDSGLPAFGSTSEDDAIGLNFEASVNPNEWTAWHVMQPIPRSSGTGPGVVIELVEASPDSGEIAIVIGFTRGGLENYFLYEDGRRGIQRISYAANFAQRSSPSLMMTTFSTRNGLKIYDGGELVASEPDDKRPLTQHDGDYSLFRNGRGRWGMAGLLNIDLGAPENTGHRRAIENFLMAKYGIPQGAQ